MTTITTPAATRFQLVDYDSATPEVKEIYDETMQMLQLPFVLNWFKCQGNNPTLLRGNWEKLKSTLLLGDVPNVLKQLIIYNVSQERGCSYCAEAHGIFADSMSHLISDEADYKATQLDSPKLPNSYKEAIKVVTKAALNHAMIGDEDVAQLASAGFAAGEIQELMAQADLVNMLNTLADISGIQLDGELASARA